jgi:hypothetical protein
MLHLKEKIDAFNKNYSSLLDKRKELISQSNKTMLEVNRIIKSVRDCSKSLDCTTRKEMALSQINLLKQELQLLEKKMARLENERKIIEKAYNSKIQENKKLLIEIKNNKAQEVQADIARENLGGDKKINRLFALIVSLVMYPIYIILLFLREHVAYHNVIYRHENQKKITMRVNKNDEKILKKLHNKEKRELQNNIKILAKKVDYLKKIKGVRDFKIQKTWTKIELGITWLITLILMVFAFISIGGI